MRTPSLVPKHIFCVLPLSSVLLLWQDVDEFDTTNPGPWMLKWEITNENRHTAALPADNVAKWGHLILG